MSSLDVVKFAISRGVRYEAGIIYGVSGRPLAPRPAGKGYRVVGLPKPDGGFTNIYVHKLVYYFETGDERAFEVGYEIDHANHDRSDNRFENLMLMASHDHESQSSRLNLRNARITVEIANKIRTEYQSGQYTQKQLASKYDLSQQHISDIVTGKKWGEKWGVDVPETSEVIRERKIRVARENLGI